MCSSYEEVSQVLLEYTNALDYFNELFENLLLGLVYSEPEALYMLSKLVDSYTSLWNMERRCYI